MLKNIIKRLSNPILFYADKSGNSVFKNFGWFKNTGNLYEKPIAKQSVGKALEYRFELDKYMNCAYIMIPIILYLIFIHVKFSLWNLLVCEFWWILLVCICKGICSYLYSQYLVRSFGPYKLTQFSPKLPPEKWEQYAVNFKAKIIILAVAIVLFFIPAFLLQFGINASLKTKKNNFNNIINLSKVYLALYPKTENIYDMRAYAKYMTRDYEGALADYKTVLDMRGKHFNKKDFARFANLLLLEKKLNGPQNAVVAFNDYATRKKLSVLEESQMLWIKSIFSIENNIEHSIIQDYDDLLSSLSSKDAKNYFYISSDKAYIMYLLRDYAGAIDIYNMLISYAEGNRKEYSKTIRSLYAERAFAKKRLGDNDGANLDVINSKIDVMEIDKYEPSYYEQEFLIGY